MFLKKWLPGLLMPLLFLLLVLLLQLLPAFLCSLARAQPPSQGLAPGDTVPDAQLELVNYERPTARLSDFRGKLVILDFYATWCSASRAPMPRLDSLQQAFAGKLQILLVSYPAARDDRASVTAFLDSRQATVSQSFHLPSVVNDTVLVRHFPHNRIPHFAWIRPDGTVGAITKAHQVTASNISLVLDTGRMPASLRPEADLSLPLLLGQTTAAQQPLYYTSLLPGTVDDGPERVLFHREDGRPLGLTAANTSPLALYRQAYRHLYPALGAKGFLLRITDTLRLSPETAGIAPAAWREEYAFSYEIRLPPGFQDVFIQRMLEDLNRLSGYRGALEPLEIDCLLLVRKGRKDRMKTKGGEPIIRLYGTRQPVLQNQPLSVLLARLNSGNSLPQLVLDETGYAGHVDLEMETDFRDLDTLRGELQRYGLDLKPARRTVPVFVLRDAPQDKK